MSVVRVAKRPPLRLATLDTGKRNLLGVDAVRALREAIEPDPDAPVVVLRGRPDGFCAGLDGATLAKGWRERDELLAEMGELLLAILRSPTRVLAVCEGHAVAAGAMLLLVADVRLGAPGGYKVGFTEPRIGMPLPRLPALLARERLDRRRLHELTSLGKVVGPEEAADAGFFDAILDPVDLEAEITRRAAWLAELTDDAYRGSMDAMWRTSLDEIAREVAAQRTRTERAAPG